MVERSSQPVWIGSDERKWSHFRVDVDVLRRSMGVHEFAVYCALIAHAEVETGLSRPSEETIASYFGMSTRRVSSAVKWLEQQGWIRVSRTPGKASRYVVLPPPTAVDDDATPERGAGVEEADTGTSFRSPPNDVQDTPEPRSDELVPSDKNQEDERNMSDTSGADNDVERLCVLLADLIEANGSKRPTITKRWREECSRMIRLDTRPVLAIENAIRWSQNHTFWRANIMSMPKLRERFDTLRLQAQQERMKGRPAASVVPQSVDALTDYIERRGLAP